MGSTLKRATRMPFSMPIIVPIAIPSAKHRSGGISGNRATVKAETIPEKAIIAPIDKSIPLVISTSIIPTARIPRMDVLVSKEVIFERERNAGFLS
jgi:hypothetical protein